MIKQEFPKTTKNIFWPPAWNTVKLEGLEGVLTVPAPSVSFSLVLSHASTI